MSFPFEKMWSFQNVEHQIAMELSYFNWYQVVQEPQKAIWAFSRILRKILHAPPGKLDIQIDKEKANRFLDYYFGNGGETPEDRGLYALDIVEREFEGKYAIRCRGYGEDLDPKGHHQLIMYFYQHLEPLLWELWYEIAEQVELQGTGLPKEWIEEAYKVPTAEEAQAELEQMFEDGELLRIDPFPEALQDETPS